MKNKRESQRIHLIYYLLVFNRDSDQLVGHVVDIAANGIKLMTKESIKEGVIIRFRMLLPTQMENKSKEINFDAQCMWTKEKLYSDFFGCGFKFQDISAEDIEVIKSLIEQFGYQK